MGHKITIDSDSIHRQAAAVIVAAQKAVDEAIAAHKSAGNPIAIWENGAVRWVPPEEIGLPTMDDE